MPWNIRDKWKFGGLIGVIILSLASCTAETSNVSQVNVEASLGDYHVAKTGMDENTCAQATSPSQPKLTINGGIACLAAGDTLIVHAGTYDETIGVSVPNGTSWSNVTTIRANSGDTVVIQRTSGSFARCVEFTSDGKQYIEIDGIDCDGTLVGHDAVKFEGTTGFIRINDMEAFGYSNQGIMDAATGGGNEFLDLYLHNNGTSDFDHGIYITSDNNKIWNSDFEANTGWGIHVFKSSGSPSNNDIQYNRSWDNGAAGIRGSGIVVAGNNNLIANNIFWDNLQSGIQVLRGNSNLIYNNTSYGNFGFGISVDSGIGTLITNNITYANGGTIQDLGTGTAQTTNLTTNPLFTNAAVADFTLQSGSDAIDAGTTLAQVQDDFLGIFRPQPLGGSYDIGAYERIP